MLACAGLVDGNVWCGSCRSRPAGAGTMNLWYSRAALAPLKKTARILDCPASRPAMSLARSDWWSMAASRLPGRRALWHTSHSPTPRCRSFAVRDSYGAAVSKPNNAPSAASIALTVRPGSQAPGQRSAQASQRAVVIGECRQRVAVMFFSRRIIARVARVKCNYLDVVTM